jgi:translation initiation factor IF-2
MSQRASRRRTTKDRDIKRAESTGSSGAAADSAVVAIPHAITVKQLADILSVSAIEVIKNLMRNGIMVNINQVIDFDSAAVVATELGYHVQEESTQIESDDEAYSITDEDISVLISRPAVVTIMGHVDHGKTKLLDAIRQTNVAETEAGSITQHIGAYQVDVHGQKITFLDTPGHEAFTAMRARGARVTDIAILVVAADDGVMPQTVEAIDHAKAADVPIVVAINKIDKESANPDRVKQQLADNNLLIEEWGGNTVCVSVSAKRGDGIADLLENLLIVAEVQELKANPEREAVGVVIEAKLDSSKGSLATALVQTGTLRVGNNIVIGEQSGKIKAMFDDHGKRVKKAGPSMPVEILGINGIPQAGDQLVVVGSEKEARTLSLQRQREKEAIGKAATPRLSNIFQQIQAGQVKELDIVLKTDVQGSLEPIRTSLEKLGSEELKVRTVHSGTGNITENDVMLAAASKGVVIGFNIRPEPGAKLLADSEGIDIRCYQVIYKLVEDVEKALSGLLEPSYEDVIEGHAEVRALFDVKQGRIAGSYVTDGKLTRGAQVRVIRNGELIHESSISSLRHFKDNVREMAAGFECGIGVEGYTEFEIGDIIEAFRKEKVT